MRNTKQIYELTTANIEKYTTIYENRDENEGQPLSYYLTSNGDGDRIR